MWSSVLSRRICTLEVRKSESNTIWHGLAFFWYAWWRNNLVLRRHVWRGWYHWYQVRAVTKTSGCFPGTRLWCDWNFSWLHGCWLCIIQTHLFEPFPNYFKYLASTGSKENLAPRTTLNFFKKRRDIIKKVNTLKRIKCIFHLILYITLNSHAPFPFCSSLHIHCQCLSLILKWVLESHKLRWHLCSISY